MNNFLTYLKDQGFEIRSMDHAFRVEGIVDVFKERACIYLIREHRYVEGSLMDLQRAVLEALK